MRIYISDVLKYYSIELEKLKKNVDECNVNALDSIDFFLKEANTYDKGIPLDIEKEVRWEIDKFKRNCIAQKPTIVKKGFFS